MNMPTNAITLVALFLGLLTVVAVLSAIKAARVPPFERASLLNKSEMRLYRALRDELPDGWSIMCQVSYGAFLRNKSFQRYMSVNSKRADFIVVDRALGVAAIVEYQGAGHYGNTAKSRERAKKSDRIKRLSTSQAGLLFIEVPAKFNRDDVSALAREIMGNDGAVSKKTGSTA